MNSNQKRTIVAFGVAGVGALVWAGGMMSQVKDIRGEPATAKLSFTSQVKIEEKDGYRVITSNGIPDHAVGQFPGRGNPNSIRPQSHIFRVPLKPTPAATPGRSRLFGVALNGVPFEPGTAEMWNGDRNWGYEAASGWLGGRNGVGLDANMAHVQPTGAYHYHGIPRGLGEKLGYKSKMTLLAWAADGYPVYGPYCPTDANDLKSPLKNMASSYRLKSGTRQGGPGGTPDGSFASDFEYVAGLGDLDQFNGRTGVTPEFPGGTFYYVVTDTWPFLPRIFKGTPDQSFNSRPSGPPPGGGFGPPRGGPPPRRGGGFPPPSE